MEEKEEEGWEEKREGSLGWNVELKLEEEGEGLEEVGSFGAKDDPGRMGIADLTGDEEGLLGGIVDELV